MDQSNDCVYFSVPCGFSLPFCAWLNNQVNKSVDDCVCIFSILNAGKTSQLMQMYASESLAIGFHIGPL